MERLRRLVFDHRRLLAAVCAGLAAMAALASIRVESPDSSAVVIAARDLPSGTLLTADDVEEIAVAPDVVPDAASGATDAVIGQRLSGPMRRGETMTDARLLGPGALAGRPAGTVIATVRIADPIELESVSVGEFVDVVAVAPDGRDGRPAARIVAEGVEVVATDDIEAVNDPTGTATLRVAADRQDAVAIAEASVDARLGVLTVPDPTREP